MEKLPIVILVAAAIQVLPAQQGGPAVKVIATAEARKDGQPPALREGDIEVFQGKERLPVTETTPARAQNASLQLALLIDDSSNANIGTQFGDIRKFIDSQPPSTAIAIGYMQNGTVRKTQDFTNDHGLVEKGLRLPLMSPGVVVSPYTALSDFVKHWPAGAPRREVVMISDGIDLLGGSGMDNPYVDSAVDDARRAGVVVYTIYTGGTGHIGHSGWRVWWGQNYLSQVSDETGGESYYLAFQSPVAFAPYLEQISTRLQNQYFVTFDAQPRKKAGFESIRLRTEVPSAEVAGPDAVWVPASQ